MVAIDGTATAGLSPVEINKLVVGPQGSVAVLEVPPQPLHYCVVWRDVKVFSHIFKKLSTIII